MLQRFAIGALERSHFSQYLDGLIGLMCLDGLIALRITDVEIQFILRFKGNPIIEVHIALVHLVILKQTGYDLGRE